MPDTPRTEQLIETLMPILERHTGLGPFVLDSMAQDIAVAVAAHIDAMTEAVRALEAEVNADLAPSVWGRYGPTTEAVLQGKRAALTDVLAILGELSE